MVPTGFRADGSLSARLHCRRNVCFPAATLILVRAKDASDSHSVYTVMHFQKVVLLQKKYD
jgi:hypothetical protein